MNRRELAAIVASSTLLATRSALAQARVEIGSTVACEACEIVLTHIARVGDADGPGALSSRPYSMSRDSRGRFYVVTPEQGGEPPMVFDADGRFVARLGREGAGPGEFRAPTIVLILPGDTVLVIDGSLARLTVLSQKYGLVRTAPVSAGAWAATVLAGGELVVNAQVNTPGQIGRASCRERV